MGGWRVEGREEEWEDEGGSEGDSVPGLLNGPQPGSEPQKLGTGWMLGKKCRLEQTHDG